MTAHLQAEAQPRQRFSMVDFALLATVTIWGINSPIVKFSIHGWDPLAYNAVRFTAAAITIFLYVVVTDPNWRLSRRDFFQVALLGLVGNGIYQTLYVESISRTTASNTSLIIAMAPLVVTVWGGLTKIDRVSGWVVAGTLVSVAGGVLVVVGAPGGLKFSGVTFTGDLLAVGSMIAWGAYTVYAKGVINRVGSALRVTAWAMLLGGFPNLVIGIPALMRQDFSVVTGLSALGMTFSFLLSLVVGYVIYAWAVQRIGGARTAIYLNLTPIVAALSAWLMIGESWTSWQWAGALFVVVGVTVAKLEAIRR